MQALFPGDKRFTRWNEKGEVTAHWSSPHLNWKTNVACKVCNNGWMSQLEANMQNWQ